MRYPYLPPGRTIQYVPAENLYMKIARTWAFAHSLDKTMPGAAVIVKTGRIISIGANGSDYHNTHPCERILHGSKTGEDYQLCEGCHPKNHSEHTAIRDAKNRGNDTRGADLYLWGHWWCCKPCWDVMIAADIANVYLLEGSERLFNKAHPDNIVGKQFQKL
jgi:deoxycytidylate deaminase